MAPRGTFWRVSSQLTCLARNQCFEAAALAPLLPPGHPIFKPDISRQALKSHPETLQTWGSLENTCACPGRTSNSTKQFSFHSACFPPAGQPHPDPPDPRGRACSTPPLPIFFPSWLEAPEGDSPLQLPTGPARGAYPFTRKWLWRPRRTESRVTVPSNTRGLLRRSRRDCVTVTGQVQRQGTRSGLSDGNPDGVPTEGSCKALKTIPMARLLSAPCIRLSGGGARKSVFSRSTPNVFGCHLL